MARFFTSLAVFISMACAAALVVPGYGSSEPAPAPEPSIIDVGEVPTDPHQGFPPEPQPGFYNFVDSCVTTISPECGKEIFDGLLAKKRVSDLCCTHLIKNGKACHNAFVWVLMHLKEYKEFLPIIAKRKDEVWEDCRYYQSTTKGDQVIHNE